MIPGHHSYPKETLSYTIDLPNRNGSNDIVQEAHLHLTKTQCIGEGNHSSVYKAELKAPREMYFGLDIDKQKDSSSEIGYKECPSIKKGSEHQHSFGPGHDNNEQDISTEVSFTSISQASRDQTTHKNPILASEERLTSEDVVGGLVKPLECTSISSAAKKIEAPQSEIPDTAEAPTSLVEVAAHSRQKKEPLITTSVAVKISDNEDRQLYHEARIYQDFPSHLFEHWSGYYIMNRKHLLKYPAPLDPVVPQFYGFYTPESCESNEAFPDLQPLMLIEYCGRSLETIRISDIDDK